MGLCVVGSMEMIPRAQVLYTFFLYKYDTTSTVMFAK